MLYYRNKIFSLRKIHLSIKDRNTLQGSILIGTPWSRSGTSGMFAGAWSWLKIPSVCLPETKSQSGPTLECWPSLQT